MLRVELVVNERKIGSCRPGGAGGNHARHLSLICIVSYPFISLQFIEYIVTGDSVYYSGSLPLVEVVYKLYSANVNIQKVMCTVPGREWYALSSMHFWAANSVYTYAVVK